MRRWRRPGQCVLAACNEGAVAARVAGPPVDAQFDVFPGGSVNSGPAVVRGMVFWGSGYSRAAEGVGNNRLYAFSLGGR
jgi:hypothetical protein